MRRTSNRRWPKLRTRRSRRLRTKRSRTFLHSGLKRFHPFYPSSLSLFHTHTHTHTLSSFCVSFSGSCLISLLVLSLSYLSFSAFSLPPFSICLSPCSASTLLSLPPSSLSSFSKCLLPLPPLSFLCLPLLYILFSVRLSLSFFWFFLSPFSVSSSPFSDSSSPFSVSCFSLTLTSDSPPPLLPFKVGLLNQFRTPTIVPTQKLRILTQIQSTSFFTVAKLWLR